MSRTVDKCWLSVDVIPEQGIEKDTIQNKHWPSDILYFTPYILCTNIFTILD